MMRLLLILTCAAVLAASSGCRSCGSWFGFGSNNNNNTCCEGGIVSPGVTAYSPDISGYDDGSYLEGPISSGGPYMMSPPEAVLPAPAR